MSLDEMDDREKIQRLIKRVLDLVITTILFLFLATPMCLVATLIKLGSKGPIFFRQERIGKDGMPFMLYKFRSMKEIGQDSVFHDVERVTTIGRFIRKWRIDELPQFINVLRGDMSLVGPRPTLPYQVERYDKDQRRRLNVLPGITGWSQIHGNEAITWPARIELDLWYIDNWSLRLDIKTMLLTPVALLRIRKVNVEKAPPPDELSKF